MILLIDNYDSFTYNLYQYVGTLYKDILVKRNDEITIAEIETLNPQAIIISPGPGYPQSAGISIDVIKTFSGKIPLLGICLGHQSIVEAFGGEIVQADHLMHGKSSTIKIDEKNPIFSGIGKTLNAARYHSLIAKEESLPESLQVIALDETGQIMGVAHKEHKTYGMQFHPESILTESGMQILKNFLAESGLFKPEPKPEPANLRPYYERIMQGGTLTKDEAETVMHLIMSGNASQVQIATFLTAFAMHKETPDEIAGLAKGMRGKASLVPDSSDSIDIVGTGGDLAASFNISTTSAFVVSAAGAKVAKHGNRSVSSKSGAADVLESLGAKITSKPEQAKACLDEIGLSFLFAQSYHASMRFVGPVRAQMGVRTVFNILGPLTNPARADYIVLGVYSKDLTQLIAKALQEVGIKRAMVVYGNDCLDEISISDSTTVVEVNGDSLKSYDIAPEDFGLTRAKKEDIVGGTPVENAAITRGILEGKITGAKRDIVLLNAGAAIYTYGKAETLADGIKLAAEMIDSGKALAKLEDFVRLTNELA